MFKQIIEKDLKQAVKNVGFVTSDIVISISENPHFGDYSTNVALQLAKQGGEKSKLSFSASKQSPRDIANLIIESFGHPAYLERVEVAGAGFINFYIKDQNLLKVLEDKDLVKRPKDKTLVEFASPNAFKILHIGHLRNIVIGESLSRILNFDGDEVFKVTYTSDTGVSAAKALWGLHKLKADYDATSKTDLKSLATLLAKAYVMGTEKYENDPEAKAEIDQLNKKLYTNDPESIKFHSEVKNWMTGYLEVLYSRLGVEFDAWIWESEVAERGKEIVMENLNNVFIEDDGAIIFPGEKFGLHNRVFVNSMGYSTYEGKELGVTFREAELFPFDKAIHVVANEQSDYFKVVIKAIELIEKSMLGKKRHLAYGMVNLSTGKMSSRIGNVITIEDLIDEVREIVREEFAKENTSSSLNSSEKIAQAAIKFYMLKTGVSSDIAYDVKQSISLQGDTGVYVMYTYVRTVSVLGKAEDSGSPIAGRGSILDQRSDTTYDSLEPEEREVLRQLEYFDIVVNRAAKEYAPSYICLYLIDLSRAFNLFYEKYPILASDKADFRLRLTKKVGETLKLGLYLLGIEAVEKM